MSRTNESPRVIGGERYERRIMKGMTFDRNYSKTVTVTVGGFLDGLSARERQHMIEDMSQVALDFNWDVQVAGQHWGPGVRNENRPRRTYPNQ